MLVKANINQLSVYDYSSLRHKVLDQQRAFSTDCLLLIQSFWDIVTK